MRKRNVAFVVLALSLTASLSDAASGDINTFAGGGFGDGGPAKDATLSAAWNSALAPDGSLVVADRGHHVIRRISAGTDGTLNGDPTETISRVAGNGNISSAGDGGPAMSASFFHPRGLTFDPAGNLYVAESTKVRRIDAATGIISTFAGGSSCCTPPADGAPAAGAYIDTTDSLHWSNGAMYIGTGRWIFRVAGGAVTRVAGQLAFCGFNPAPNDNGPAKDACFVNVYGLATDAQGSLFVADSYNNRIRRIETGADGVVDGDADEIITTVAGNGSSSGIDDTKHPTAQSVRYSAGLAFDPAGNLVFTDDNTVRVLSPGNDGIVNASPDERVSTLAGDLRLVRTDGTPARAQLLDFPRDVDLLPDGSIVVSDTNHGRIRVIDGNGIMRTIAGNATFNGDGGLATDARLSGPAGVTRVGSDLYISDYANLRIRRVDAAGVITTVGGGGAPLSGNGDGGHPREARLGRPSDITADAGGNLYFVDTDGNRVRKITSGADGVVNGGSDERISTVVQSPVPNTGTVGPFFPTQLSLQAVAIGSDGSVYVSSPTAVWRVAPDGAYTRVAGTDERGSWGDCNEHACDPASEAGFTYISDMEIDAAGRLYVVDLQAGRVRLITPGADGLLTGAADEFVSTVAGTCVWNTYLQCTGFSGNGGPATNALMRPNTLALGTDGTLYVGESTNYRVRRIVPGADGVVTGASDEIITTFAGQVSSGFSGDGGPALSARFSGIADLAVGPGAVWVADSSNDRVRMVEL